MTPLERAVAANHPSTYRRESDASAHPPCDATSVTGVVGAAASATPAPTPWEFCHSTASTIESLTDRLRKLKAGRT